MLMKIAWILDYVLINQLVFRIRFLFFRLKNGIKQNSEIHEFSLDVQRSKSKLYLGKTNHLRPKWAREPLLRIANKEKLKVLSIGTRFETEILYLLAAGFKNIRGLDTFSYSPYIDIGDIHSMPYEDNTFDIIIAGWIFPYSRDPKIFRDEIIRVGKDGSIVSVGVSSYTKERYSYIITGKKNMVSPHNKLNVESINFEENLQTVEQFRDLFQDNLKLELYTKNPYLTTGHYDNDKDYCIYCFQVDK